MYTCVHAQKNHVLCAQVDKRETRPRKKASRRDTHGQKTAKCLSAYMRTCAHAQRNHSLSQCISPPKWPDEHGSDCKTDLLCPTNPFFMFNHVNQKIRKLTAKFWCLLDADFAMLSLASLRLQPNFGQNSKQGYRNVKGSKIKFILSWLLICKDPKLKILILFHYY